MPTYITDIRYFPSVEMEPCFGRIHRSPFASLYQARRSQSILLSYSILGLLQPKSHGNAIIYELGICVFYRLLKHEGIFIATELPTNPVLVCNSGSISLFSQLPVSFHLPSLHMLQETENSVDFTQILSASPSLQP